MNGTDDRQYKQQEAKNHTAVKAVALGMVVLILSSGMYYLLNLNDEAGDELIKDKTLGERLDDTGWMMYGASYCEGCKTQKDIIGDEIKGLKIHCCDASIENNKVCHEQGIILVPTWQNVFSNETKVGILSLEQLEEMTK